MLRKIGFFLLLIGIACLVLFFVSDFAQTPNYPLFGSGFVLTILGWLLRRRAKAEEASRPSARFRTLRRLTSRQIEEEKFEDQEG